MNQRRRPSPAVYRRRRLVAALLAVVLLALVVWGGRAVYDAFFESDTQPATAAQTDPEQNTENDDAPESEPPEPTEPEEVPEEPVAEGHCSPADVEVRASTSHETYDASTAPLLIMEIENVGSQECTVDVGTAEQQFQVGTGGREIFTTDQCDLNGESLEIEFEPGQTERAQMLWPRSDSAVDCAEPAEIPGGDYELTVSVSGISSDPHSFEIGGNSG